MECLELRVARLERANRRLSSTAGLGALAAIGMALSGFARIPAPVDLIQAKRIEIVGADGKAVVELASDADGGTFRLSNSAGQPQLGAMVDGGGVFALSNGQGALQVTISSDKNGGLINAYTAGGKSAVVVGADADGGLVTLGNKAGAGVMVLTSDADGGLFAIDGADGKPRVTAGVDGGQGFLGLLDAGGNPIR